MESLEDRQLLAADVFADQAEYLSEQPVLLTVNGLEEGETAELQVRRVDVASTSNPLAFDPWQIADGSQFDTTSGGDIDDGGNFDLDGSTNGSLQTQWAIPSDETPGGTYEVTATALNSGEIATWQFKAGEEEPVAVSLASVTTDKEDYQPGETAVVTATGFTPGETVEFLVLHNDDVPNTGEGHGTWQVADGSLEDLDGTVDGNIQTTWLVTEDDSLNSIFELTADGLTSGESATSHFSDALTRLFYETFEYTRFIYNRWEYIDADISGWALNSGPYTSHSNHYAELDGNDEELRSRVINLGSYASGTLSYQLQNTGKENRPESVDRLRVQYQKSNGSWAKLEDYTTSNTSSTSFTTKTVTLPFAAFHSNFKFRFNAYDSDGSADDWFVDVVQLHAKLNKPPSISTSGGGSGLDTADHTMSWTTSDPEGQSVSVVAQLQRETTNIGDAKTSKNGSIVVYGDYGPGRYRLKVKATDSLGGTKTSYSSYYTITDDDTAGPTIIVSGSSGIEPAANDQYFTWSINDESDSTSEVTITKNDETILYRRYFTNVEPYTFDFNRYGEGNYTIEVSATDKDNDRDDDQLTSTERITVEVLSSPRVSFATHSSVGSESAFSKKILVELSYESDEVITVDYAVTGGSASGDGVDYQLNDGTLTFAPGETEKEISVQLTDDILVEGHESIRVTLSNSDQATLGRNQSHTITILDNEVPSSNDGKPTLTVVVHSLQDKRGVPLWANQVAEDVTAQLEKYVSGNATFTVNWQAKGGNDTPSTEIAEKIAEFLQTHGGTWDLLLIGHGRGGIFINETLEKLPNKLTDPNQLGYVQQIMLDPTGMELMGDLFPAKPAAIADKTIDYHDNHTLLNKVLDVIPWFGKIRKGLNLAGYFAGEYYGDDSWFTQYRQWAMAHNSITLDSDSSPLEASFTVELDKNIHDDFLEWPGRETEFLHSEIGGIGGTGSGVTSSVISTVPMVLEFFNAFENVSQALGGFSDVLTYIGYAAAVQETAHSIHLHENIHGLWRETLLENDLQTFINLKEGWADLSSHQIDPGSTTATVEDWWVSSGPVSELVPESLKFARIDGLRLLEDLPNILKEGFADLKEFYSELTLCRMGFELSLEAYGGDVSQSLTSVMTAAYNTITKDLPELVDLVWGNISTNLRDVSKSLLSVYGSDKIEEIAEEIFSKAKHNISETASALWDGLSGYEVTKTKHLAKGLISAAGISNIKEIAREINDRVNDISKTASALWEVLPGDPAKKAEDMAQGLVAVVGENLAGYKSVANELYQRVNLSETATALWKSIPGSTTNQAISLAKSLVDILDDEPALDMYKKVANQLKVKTSFSITAEALWKSMTEKTATKAKYLAKSIVNEYGRNLTIYKNTATELTKQSVGLSTAVDAMWSAIPGDVSSKALDFSKCIIHSYDTNLDTFKKIADKIKGLGISKSADVLWESLSASTRKAELLAQSLVHAYGASLSTVEDIAREVNERVSLSSTASALWVALSGKSKKIEYFAKALVHEFGVGKIGDITEELYERVSFGKTTDAVWDAITDDTPSKLNHLAEGLRDVTSDYGRIIKKLWDKSNHSLGRSARALADGAGASYYKVARAVANSNGLDQGYYKAARAVANDLGLGFEKAARALFYGSGLGLNFYDTARALYRGEGLSLSAVDTAKALFYSSGINRSASDVARALYKGKGLDFSFGKTVDTLRSAGIRSHSSALRLVRSINGYTQGSVVFFDANLNGIFDLNEESAFTDATGTVKLVVGDEFDLNGNGTIDDDEGQWIVSGGIDTSTGLPTATKLVAPATSNIVSPLTSLATKLASNHDITFTEASNQVIQSMGLPEIDLMNFDPIKETLSGNVVGAQVFAAHARVQDTLVQTTAVFRNQISALTNEEISERALKSLADVIASSNSVLTFSDSDFIETLVHDVRTSTGIIINEEILTGAATVIAANNQKIDSISQTSDLDYLVEVSKVKSISQGVIAQEITLAAIGEQTIDSVVQSNTGDALEAKIAATVIPPIINVPSQIFAEATGPNGAEVNFTVLAYDIGGQPVPVLYNLEPGSKFALGDTIVMATATDSLGNSVTESFMITVVDTVAPGIVIVDQTFEATSENGAAVTLPNALATDLVDPAPLVSFDLSSGVFPLGVTLVTATATDSSGNTTSIEFEISVVDTTMPDLDIPENIVIEANATGGANVTLPEAMATDLVDISPHISNNPTSGFMPLGITLVTSSASDDFNNSIDGTFTVTVVDTTPPVFSTQPNLVIEGNTTGGASVSVLDSLVVDLADPNPLITYNIPTGILPLGTTQVTATAIDASGNVQVASFPVTVVDSVSPDIILPNDLIILADGPEGAIVAFPEADATDLVDASPFLSYDSSSGLFPLGTTEVIVRANDSSGNFTEASFNVTVVDNNTNERVLPAITQISRKPTEGNSVFVTGEAIDLDAVSDTSGITFNWMAIKEGALVPFVSITAIDQTDFTFIPDDNGVYEIILTVSKDGGITSTASTTIQVDNLGPEVDLSYKTTHTAEGTTILLTADTDDASPVDNEAGFTYEWNVTQNGELIVLEVNELPTLAMDSDGIFEVSLTVTDKDGDSTEVLRTVGDAIPVAMDGSLKISEDSTVAGTLLTTDSDGDTLTYLVVNGPSHGSLVLNTSGSFIYIPNSNYYGEDFFTYNANDGTNESNVATVDITVTSVNDAPLVHSDTLNIDEDESFSGILPSATDIDTEALNYALVGSASHGTVTLEPDGSFLYEPDSNYHGNDSFTYLANDGQADSNIASVSIIIAPVNDSPVANAGADITVNEGESIAFNGSSSFDVDSDSDLNYAWDFGDGYMGYGLNPNHVFENDGPYEVTLLVSDSNNAKSSNAVTITVLNVAPTVSIIGLPFNSNEGENMSLESTVVDPGLTDNFTYSWSVTKDNALYSSSEKDDFIFSPKDNGTYDIELMVSDEDGGSTVTSHSISVANIAPVIDSLASTSVDENGIAHLTGTYSDVGLNDTHKLMIDWGEGVSEIIMIDGGTFNITHQYLDDNPSGTSIDTYTIMTILADDDLGSDAGKTDMTVTNIAPVLNPLVLSSSTIDENGDITVSGTFTDPGTIDTHKVAISWGDSTETTVFKLNTGERTFTATHRYLNNHPSGASGAAYPISLSITDDDSGRDVATATLLVKNVAPVVAPLVLSSPIINENGSVTLTGTVSDQGVYDDLDEVTIQWGDGSNSVVTLDDHPSISDSDFNAADWVSVAATTGGGSATTTYTAGTGTIDFTMLDPPVGSYSQHVLVNLLQSQTYDPSAEGALAALDFSINSRLDPATHADEFVLKAAIRQNGNLFLSKPFGYAWPGGIRHYRAGDFYQEGQPSNNPDFSSSGGEIEFGYASSVLILEGNSDRTFSAEFDDMQLALFKETNARTFTATHQYLDDPTGTPDDYTISVTVTDDYGDSTFAEQTITVNNVAPTVNNNNVTVDLVENSGDETLVTTVTATDPAGVNDPIIYSILGNSEDSAFKINSTTGVISVNNPTLLDYESNPVLTFQVEAIDGDGGSDIAEVTVNLLNQASISGVVYVDINEDGIYQANEPGIDGTEIELRDASGNSVKDEHGLAITAITSDGGFYLFDDLDPGDYQIFQQQPSGVTDGADILGSLGGAVVGNDTMQLSLARVDALDYAFAEIGGQVTSGESAGIGFWQNKHGQQLIASGGSGLASWLSTNFDNVFGNSLAGASGNQVASFYRNQLFMQKSKKSSGPAKVDAQFMATALNVYFTNQTLAGDVGASYGLTVSDTGLGVRVVNVETRGDAFGVDDGTSLTIMQLLLATNALTDTPDTLSGFASIYDTNGDGIIDADEARLRALANDMYSWINEQ